MPVIKVWCLPANQTEEKLNSVHRSIVSAVVGIAELGLRDENDVTCLFVPDRMSYGLGEEIIIEIGGLFEKPERTKEVRQLLAKNVGLGIKKLYPEAKVECFISSFNSESGFWTSVEKTIEQKSECPDCCSATQMISGVCPSCGES